MKRCVTCKKDKEESDFSSNYKAADGKQSNCRCCNIEYSKRYRSSNLVSIKEKKKEKFASLTIDQKRSLKYINRYGITVDHYNEMLMTQNGVCAICSKSPSGKKQRLCVDHCHKTGEVRGLLCNDCNVGIGRLKDDIELLVSAIVYLEGIKND